MPEMYIVPAMCTKGWDKVALRTLPVRGGIITADDERIERYREDTMMRGSPDAVLVARDEQEVAEALAYCNAKRIPVTFCGSQTSMTGASVPLDGLLISTEMLEGVIDISKTCFKTRHPSPLPSPLRGEGGVRGGAVATVRPGTIVADLQRAVAEAGYFYPVAPTSRDECRISANVATNATGEDSYKYGPIRQYIRSLDLILPNGNLRTLERTAGEKPSWERNRAGYFTGWENPIDLIIGSEGTLGFVSKITLDLLPKGPLYFSALIPLSSNKLALDLVIEIAKGTCGLAPRTLELIDSGALTMMRTADGFPGLPDDAHALLYIKQEYEGNANRDHLLSKWLDQVLPFTGKLLADHILIATTPKDQESFRLWRHRVPEAANEIGRSLWKNGGGKIGSDWWVPIDRLREMMDFFYNIADSTGLTYMAYAHIGSGHPHTNMIARDATEKERALEVLARCCRKAVELGGGVAGEHGIGKLHTDLVLVQHPPEVVEMMRAWKREYDPEWILGRGNIFDTN